MAKKISICTILAIFLLVIFFLPWVKVLSISNRKKPEQRIYSAEAYSKGFCISYTHSVNKGRIHDYYVCDKKNNHLIMTETHFVSYGAGIPEPEETEGADFQVLENGYIIRNINRQVPQLLMAVGIIAEHTFSACSLNTEKIGEPSKEILFKNYFAPQTSLILKYKRINLLEYITHRIQDDSIFNKTE